MTLREYIRALKARRNMRRGTCPICGDEDVLIAPGPGTARVSCGPCWADTAPEWPEDDRHRDPGHDKP